MTRAEEPTGLVRRMGRRAAALAALLCTLVVPTHAAAQHSHDHTGEFHGQTGGPELHFSHPLVSECVRPASMLAVGHAYYTVRGATPEHRLQLEGELAINRSLSVQVHSALDYRGTLQHFEVGLKAATFSFAGSGLLLGYGLGVRVPVTEALGDRDPDLAIGEAAPPDGHDHEHTAVEPVHGHAVWGLDPFVNFGFRRGSWELIGWTSAGVDAETRGPELGYRVTSALRLNTALTALLELDGPGGHGPDGDAVTVAPGVLIQPRPDGPVVLGLSAGVPLTRTDVFGPRAEARLLWHF